MTKYDIYICYSAQDKPYARQIIHELEHNGFKVFIDDQNISSGETFNKTITQAIHSAQIFIPLITNNFNQSNWCQMETLFAIKEERQIIPCTLDGFQRPAWLLFSMGNITAIQLNMQDFPDENFRTLVRRIKDILKSETDHNTTLPQNEETLSPQCCKLKFVNDNDSEITIMIDGALETTLQPDEVKIIKREPGTYTVKTILQKTIENKFDQQFKQENNGSIIHLKSSSSTSEGHKKYKCFIAGATTITNERNAARAVISMLHNDYERFNCNISSYTFEDFSNRHNEYGQQDLYFDFIQNTADCVIFIICKRVGRKTKEEYLRAMSALTEHGSRPAIFVYNDARPKYDSTGHLLAPADEVEEFQKTVQSQNCYWANYQDIDNLMNLIRIDIDQELKKALNLQPLTI